MPKKTDKYESANNHLEKDNIRWVQGHFVDLLGYLRSYSSPADEYTKHGMWKSGISIDGSSVKGFSDIHFSDMNVVPDPESLVTLPWTEGKDKTAMVMVDTHMPITWEPFEGGPRNIAKRADKAVKDAGYTMIKHSPELEFFLFKSLNDAILKNDVWSADSLSGLGNIKVFPQMLEQYSAPRYILKPKEAYFATEPVDPTADFRNEFSRTIMDMGIPVKYHHHEGGSSQIEVEFRAVDTAVKAADLSTIYKFVARNVGAKYGLVPTFMPKPMFSDSGNGMHVHMTLWKGDRNTFFDKDGDYGLSQTARYFIGGLLEHAAGATAITNPTINSYRRLVPGTEAPVYVAWSVMNRSALLRVPDHTDDLSTVNCEVRHPDTSSNPYLVFSVMTAAGLDGIKKKIEPGDPVNENIYNLSAARRKKLNITELPSTLGNALELLESDDLVKNVLGSHAYDKFLELKKSEWKAYCTFVSPWEHYRYFDI